MSSPTLTISDAPDFGEAARRYEVACSFERTLMVFVVREPSEAQEGRRVALVLAEHAEQCGRVYRKCQECQAVRLAAEFTRVGGGGAGLRAGPSLLRCPSCGYVGPRVAFPLASPPDGAPS